MIKLKNKLSYKNYLLSNFYRLKDSVIDQLFLAFFLLLFVINLMVYNYAWAVVILLFPVLINFLVPLIRFLQAKFYFKAEFIEYFFGEKTLGYAIIGRKFEIELEQVESILTFKDRFEIKLSKGSLYFMGEPEEIEKISKKLKASKVYKKLV